MLLKFRWVASCIDRTSHHIIMHVFHSHSLTHKLTYSLTHTINTHTTPHTQTHTGTYMHTLTGSSGGSCGQEQIKVTVELKVLTVGITSVNSTSKAG